MGWRSSVHTSARPSIPRPDAFGLGMPLRIYILEIAHLACSDFEIMTQDTKDIEKYIKADFSDLGSIFNLGNARLGDADHLGQLALRQAKPLSTLHDFFDKQFFLA